MEKDATGIKLLTFYINSSTLNLVKYDKSILFIGLVIISTLSGCGHRVGTDYLTQSERTLLATVTVLEPVVSLEEQYINSKSPVRILPQSDGNSSRFLRASLIEKQSTRRIDDLNQAAIINKISAEKAVVGGRIEFHEWTFRLGTATKGYSREIEVIFYVQTEIKREWWKATVQATGPLSPNTRLEYVAIKTEYRP